MMDILAEENTIDQTPNDLKTDKCNTDVVEDKIQAKNIGLKSYHVEVQDEDNDGNYYIWKEDTLLGDKVDCDFSR